MKKTLFILLLLISFITFSQENGKVKLPVNIISSINAYPNPFNQQTSINFTSSTDSSMDFLVQDLLGNIVHSETKMITKGRNSISFYKKKLTSGIYIYTLKGKNKIISKRFVIK